MREARIVIAFDRLSMYLLVDKARNICLAASENRVKIVACMIDAVEGCLPASFVSALTYHNRQLEKRWPISLID